MVAVRAQRKSNSQSAQQVNQQKSDVLDTVRKAVLDAMRVPEQATTTSATPEVQQDTRARVQGQDAAAKGKLQKALRAGPNLREGARGPLVRDLQEQLNARGFSPGPVDGIFGPKTEAAVKAFQAAQKNLKVDGIVGKNTRAAFGGAPASSGPRAGVRQPDPASAPASNTPASNTPTSKVVGTGNNRLVSVGDNRFRVSSQTRQQLGTKSVPGNRKVAMDSNFGRSGPEILRPLIVIPNNATRAERAAAQKAVDGVAKWMKDNLGGRRASTGIVKTRAQNGRGIRGFFHTEFHSVNDKRAVDLIKSRPKEYARILGQTLGSIDGAQFIAPHGRVNRRGITDTGARSVVDGRTTELGLARHVIREGFFKL